MGGREKQEQESVMELEIRDSRVQVESKEQQIVLKDQEIRELRAEIRELRAEIRELRAEIRVVETDIPAFALGTWERKALEEKLPFIQGQISRLQQQILNFQQQITILMEDVRSLRSTQGVSASTEGEPSSKKPKRSPAERPSLDLEATYAEETYIRNLLAPPSDLPISVPDLVAFLSWKSGPLPVSSHAVRLMVNDSSLVDLYSPAQAELAGCVSNACKSFLLRPNSEADSSHKLRCVTGDFLVMLNYLAPGDQRLLHLEVTMDSSRNPGSALASSALFPLMRPDFAMYIRDALILRWENKFDSAHFSWAMKENSEKLKVWSPLYYGELPYVIGGCCGGRKFQWLKLSPKGKRIVAEPVSKEYDLWTGTSLAELLHSVVQMHRLLQRLQKTLTSHIPVKLYKEIKRGKGTVLLGPEHVLKTLVPPLPDKRVEFLRTLYRSISGSKYLIQLKGKIIHLKGSTKLTLYPVGHPIARPSDLAQLKMATHDMLHGLAELHKAGYTHRDLRWDNCIRGLVKGEMKWVIIDLEYAGQDGDIWDSDALVNWDSRTLNDNKSYTKGSDMYELGKLIVNWLNESGSQGSAEEQRIRALGKRLMKERGEAATMLGDVCQKPCARCAIFNS